MRPDEQSTLNDDHPPRPRRKFDLIFFETVSEGRTYLCFTRLAVILIVGLTVVSLATLLIFFSFRYQSNASEPVNVTIPLMSPPLTRRTSRLSRCLLNGLVRLEL